MKRFIVIAVSLLLAGFAFADAKNTMVILKTTHLTGDDALKFQQIFSNIKNQKEISIQCKDKTCDITTSIDGFSGSLASKLLDGRKNATFTSVDQQFRMHCAKYHTTEFCNVIQHHSVMN